MAPLGGRKGATMDSDKSESPFGPVIYGYSRSQAIEDGILADMDAGDLRGMAKQAGIAFPVAMTTTAFHAYVWPVDDPEAEDRLRDLGQDPKGRAWDVLWMLRFAIRAGRGGDTIRFQLRVVPNSGRKQAQTVTLKAVCGPADDMSPCITIMLPDED